MESAKTEEEKIARLNALLGQAGLGRIVKIKEGDTDGNRDNE